MHPLLARQLKSCLPSGDMPESVRRLVEMVDQAYQGFDVAHLNNVEEALRLAEEDYRNMFQHATVGMFRTTGDGSYLRCNPALARIYGYESAEELQESVRDVKRQLYVEDDARAKFIRQIQENGRISGFEARVYRKDGSIIWISESARIARDADGTFLYYEGFVADITERKAAQDALRESEERYALAVRGANDGLWDWSLRDGQIHFSTRWKEMLGAAEEEIGTLPDGLTGLPNRVLFLDRLERSIARMARDSNHHFAALFLDLDRFKVINDSLGHGAGDQLLVALAQRLGACLRPGDTVARLGGDEFTVLLEDPKEPDDAVGVADRVLAALKKPFVLGSHEVYVTASIGIALSSTGYLRPQDVLRDADTAMYRAKAMGKSRYQVFDTSMHARAVRLLEVENDLRRAIDRNEFELHYQPIMRIGTGRIRAFEALIRWRHPERGLVAPMDFIPVAEETGLILPIGRWVLNEACRQAAGWHAMFPADLLDININLSGKQFSQNDLVEQVMTALRQHNFPARNLTLEITESVVMENPEATIAMLQRLKALGIQLNIDDFGTGYSSLAYLQRFPVDTMKIDRSFVSRMSDGPEAAEIVRTIVALAHNLNMKVTAEGIETADQLSQLKGLDCENAQGYFLSRPVDSQSATDLLRKCAGIDKAA